MSAPNDFLNTEYGRLKQLFVEAGASADEHAQLDALFVEHKAVSQ